LFLCNRQWQAVNVKGPGNHSSQEDPCCWIARDRQSPASRHKSEGTAELFWSASKADIPTVSGPNHDRETLKKSTRPIASRTVLISRTWEGSRGIASISLHATMGNMHNCSPDMPVRHRFSDTLPAISPPDPVSCDAPPITISPICRTNDGNSLSRLPPRSNGPVHLAAISRTGGGCHRNRPPFHTHPLTYSVFFPSPGTCGSIFCFVHP
jgi:hypothetical protein